MTDCFAATADKVLRSDVYLRALRGEDIAANPLAMGKKNSNADTPSCIDSHSRLMPAHKLRVLTADQRADITGLYKELIDPATLQARQDQIRGTLKTLLEGAIAAGLQTLPDQMQADLETQRTTINNLKSSPQDQAIKALLEKARETEMQRAQRVGEIAKRFESVNFDPKDVGDIASDIVGDAARASGNNLKR